MGNNSENGYSTLGNLAQMILAPRTLRVLGWTYGAMCAALWVSLLVAFFSGNDRKPASSIGPDFSAFYTAAWMVYNGKSDKLYNFSSQHEVQTALKLNESAGHLSAWVHPPHGALLLAPLANFSPRVAYALSCLFLLLCVVVGLGILRRHCPRLQAREYKPLWVLALLCAPIYFSFSAGQITGLMFLLHVIVLSAFAQNRQTLSGLCVVAGLLKPHLFLAWLLFWFAQKQWRAIMTFAIGTLLIVMLSIGIFGHDVFTREWAALQSETYQHHETLHAYKMFSWPSFWRLFLGHNTIATVLGASFALAILGRTIWLWTKSHDTILLGAISVASIVLIVPHLPVYDLGLLVISTLIWTDRVLDYPREKFVDLRLGLLALVIFATLGDAWAQETRFQIVVPLLTFVWWRTQSLLNGVEQKCETT